MNTIPDIKNETFLWWLRNRLIMFLAGNRTVVLNAEIKIMPMNGEFKGRINCDYGLIANCCLPYQHNMEYGLEINTFAKKDDGETP